MNFGVYAPNSGRVVNAQLKVLIADITLTSSGSFEQIPIPAGFDHLEIVATLRGTVSATADQVHLIYNGDTTAANYSSQNLDATGTTVSTVRADTPRIGTTTGSTSTAGDFVSMVISLPQATASSVRRTTMGINVHRRDATTQYVNIVSHNWESTEPVTSITIRTDNHATDLFAAGSRVQVFGLGTFAVALAR